MNCRFCFRQNFSYHEIDPTFENEIELIKKNKDLTEVILSGGDPLILKNEILENLLNNLSNIPHIKRIRIHTRLLTAFPSRVDKPFLKILSNIKKQIIFVLHVNHPNELDEKNFLAIKKIQKLNIPFLSQSVLLKDINDNTKTLFDLYETL
jgi:KamA family protein